MCAKRDGGRFKAEARPRAGLEKYQSDRAPNEPTRRPRGLKSVGQLTSRIDIIDV